MRNSACSPARASHRITTWNWCDAASADSGERDCRRPRRTARRDRLHRLGPGCRVARVPRRHAVRRSCPAIRPSSGCRRGHPVTTGCSTSPATCAASPPSDGSGHALPWRKSVGQRLDRARRDGASSIELRYDVLATRSFVANAYVDDTRGYILPGALFLYLPGRLRQPVTVQGGAATQLGQRGDGPRPRRQRRSAHLHGADFDVLYDSPILMGNLESLPPFEVRGVRHDFIGYRLGDFDRAAFMQRSEGGRRGRRRHHRRRALLALRVPRHRAGPGRHRAPQLGRRLVRRQGRRRSRRATSASSRSSRTSTSTTTTSNASVPWHSARSTTTGPTRRTCSG